MTAVVAVLQLLQQMAVDLSPLSWKPGVGDVVGSRVAPRHRWTVAQLKCLLKTPQPAPTTSSTTTGTERTEAADQ